MKKTSKTAIDGLTAGGLTEAEAKKLVKKKESTKKMKIGGKI